MGLYLCVFGSDEIDEELEGVEVGGYDDFQKLRLTVAERLEGGNWGSRFPVLMSHPDSDGDWTIKEASDLAIELEAIARELSGFAPEPFPLGSWKNEVAKSVGLLPQSLEDCFFDVDGDPLLRRLRRLCKVAVDHGRPISFQ